MNPDLKSCAPILRVRDGRASLDYYTRILGFTKNWEHQFEPHLPLFVSISRGAVTLFLSEHSGDGSPNTHVYLYVGDIHSLDAEFRTAGARIIRGPENMEWGMTELFAEDLDSNVLRFGMQTS